MNKLLIITMLSSLSFISQAAVLKAHHNVLISKIRQPVNGPRQDTQHTDQASLALTQSFRKASHANVRYNSSCRSVDCLAGPKSKRFTYYVSPQWVFWNDTDKKHPAIKIAIYDIKSRQVLATKIIQAASSSALIGKPTPVLTHQISLTVQALYADK